MIDYKINKSFRLLSIYEKLNKGELLNKNELAQEYNVTEKTTQRDIDDLRAYIAETHLTQGETVIKYDKIKKGYRLVKFEQECLTNKEILAVSKILLESRAFCKQEMDTILSKLFVQSTANDRKQIEDVIKNEQFYYVPLMHNKKLLDPVWELSQCVTKSEITEIRYTRMDGVTRDHKVKPVAIMFSEYYFYLIAFMADDSKTSPTLFRIDRLNSFKTTGEKFRTPYNDKFNDGKFRKLVQFMLAGKFGKLTFEYSGPSLEAILDKLPTAKVLNENDGIYTIKVEGYIAGIDMWLKTQGDYVEILE